MKSVINRLVQSYESGALSRRQLVTALAQLTGAGVGGASLASAFQENQAPPMQASTIDHVSIQVNDLERSANFYKSVFGLPLLNEDKVTKTIRLRVGTSRIALRGIGTAGVADHIAFGVAHLDKKAVAEKLKQQGVMPLDTGEPLQFHVVDPDGYPVQIISLDNR